MFFVTVQNDRGQESEGLEASEGSSHQVLIPTILDTPEADHGTTARFNKHDARSRLALSDRLNVHVISLETRQHARCLVYNNSLFLRNVASRSASNVKCAPVTECTRDAQ